VQREIAEIYDEFVADHYDEDPFAILADSRAQALAQIERHLAPRAIAALDLAMGTGGFLLDLRPRFPGARLAGIDVSAKMIEAARRKASSGGAEIRAIHDDAVRLGEHVEPGSVDLVAMHFLLAYVEPRRIIAEAARALKPGGFFSIATSTLESFPKLQSAVAALLPAGFFDSKVPESREELRAILRANGFVMVEEQVHEKVLEFPSYDALYRFGVPSGWFTHWFLRLDESQVQTLRLAEAQFFPFDDTVQIDVLLAQKCA
jgi:SAM-dependent methyltransferase